MMSKVEMAILACGCELNRSVSILLYHDIDWEHATSQDLTLLSEAHEGFLTVFALPTRLCAVCKETYRIKKVTAEQVEEIVRNTRYACSTDRDERNVRCMIGIWRLGLIHILPPETLANLGIFDILTQVRATSAPAAGAYVQ
jgi:hypothetical protein